MRLSTTDPRRDASPFGGKGLWVDGWGEGAFHGEGGLAQHGGRPGGGVAAGAGEEARRLVALDAGQRAQGKGEVQRVAGGNGRRHPERRDGQQAALSISRGVAGFFRVAFRQPAPAQGGAALARRRPRRVRAVFEQLRENVVGQPTLEFPCGGFARSHHQGEDPTLGKHGECLGFTGLGFG